MLLCAVRKRKPSVLFTSSYGEMRIMMRSPHIALFACEFAEQLIFVYPFWTHGTVFAAFLFKCIYFVDFAIRMKLVMNQDSQFVFAAINANVTFFL